MRDIKFRAWDGEQMVSPDYITRDGCAFWKENSMPTMSKRLMQYTGLKDKNDKEIYEGDIIKTPKGNIVEVRWCEVSEMCKTPNGTDEFQYTGFAAFNIKRQRAFHLDDSVTKGEIIGNIFQNPELLTTS